MSRRPCTIAVACSTSLSVGLTCRCHLSTMFMLASQIIAFYAGQCRRLVKFRSTDVASAMEVTRLWRLLVGTHCISALWYCVMVVNGHWQSCSAVRHGDRVDTRTSRPCARPRHTCRPASGSTRSVERQTFRQFVWRDIRCVQRQKREIFWQAKVTLERSTLQLIWRFVDVIFGRERAQTSSSVTANAVHAFFDAKVTGVRSLTHDVPQPVFTDTPPTYGFSNAIRRGRHHRRAPAARYPSLSRRSGTVCCHG